MNSSGPNTEPRGTPEGSGNGCNFRVLGKVRDEI